MLKKELLYPMASSSFESSLSAVMTAGSSSGGEIGYEYDTGTGVASFGDCTDKRITRLYDDPGMEGKIDPYMAFAFYPVADYEKKFISFETNMAVSGRYLIERAYAINFFSTSGYDRSISYGCSIFDEPPKFVCKSAMPNLGGKQSYFDCREVTWPFVVDSSEINWLLNMENFTNLLLFLKEGFTGSVSSVEGLEMENKNFPTFGFVAGSKYNVAINYTLQNVVGGGV